MPKAIRSSGDIGMVKKIESYPELADPQLLDAACTSLEENGRRSKRTLHSALDDLPGIGEKRRRLLIERFGSASGVKQASQQDLMNVLGRKVGKTLYDELHVR